MPPEGMGLFFIGSVCYVISRVIRPHVRCNEIEHIFSEKIIIMYLLKPLYRF